MAALAAFAAVPAALFWAARLATAEFFRRQFIPLPFDRFGEAAGGAAAFFWLALAFYVYSLIRR